MEKRIQFLKQLCNDGFIKEHIGVIQGTGCVWRSKSEEVRENLERAEALINRAETVFFRHDHTNVMDKPAIDDFAWFSYTATGIRSRAEDMTIVLAMLPDFLEIRVTTWAISMARPIAIPA